MSFWRVFVGRAAVSAVVVSVVLSRAMADEPAKLGPAPEGAFSIVVIPDTQEYRKPKTEGDGDSEALTNPAFEAHMQWILDNIKSQRIEFVSHVGDIVDQNIPAQWQVARRCMDRLHGVVPYGISVGNHDMKNSGDSSLFQEYFPASRFTGFPWYEGTYAGSGAGVSGDNANSYQRFSAEGLDFVFLHLECNAPDDVLKWADGVLDANADRRAIVTTHMGLGPLNRPKTPRDYIDAPKGRMVWTKRHGSRGNSPQQMWDKCFCKHANLFLVFSGDQSRTQAFREVSQNDQGKPVYELLSDYHDHWLRVNRFLPQANRIEVYTIDSRDGTLCSKTDKQPDPKQHQFTLEYEMSAARRPAEAAAQSR